MQHASVRQHGEVHRLAREIVEDDLLELRGGRGSPAPTPCYRYGESSQHQRGHGGLLVHMVLPRFVPLSPPRHFGVTSRQMADDACGLPDGLHAKPSAGDFPLAARVLAAHDGQMHTVTPSLTETLDDMTVSLVAIRRGDPQHYAALLVTQGRRDAVRRLGADRAGPSRRHRDVQVGGKPIWPGRLVRAGLQHRPRVRRPRGHGRDGARNGGRRRRRTVRDQRRSARPTSTGARMASGA